jgi:integrase
MRKRLTEEGVKKLAPPSREIELVNYHDTACPGLVLAVSYGGTKTWRVIHYAAGKARSHQLGRFPVVCVAEARRRAQAFLLDPQGAVRQANVKSFGAVADEFLKRHVAASKLRTEPEIRRVLDVYVRPRWGDRPFAEIKRGDVRDLLDRIEDNHGARQADMVLAILRKLMNWYMAGHDDYVSPIVSGMARSKPSDHKRERILSDDEIRALWRATDDMGSFGALTRLLLLTAQRREKVNSIQWDDIKDGLWSIRREPREKANAGSLRLPEVALSLIATQPRIASNPFIFAGRGEATAFNSWSQRKEELDVALLAHLRRADPKAKLPHWTFHDLRRTARSLMSRAGVRPDIAERVLGHAIAGVEGVYDRYSYDEQKAEALEALAGLVGRMIEPPRANVVPMQPRIKHVPA